MGIIFDVYVFKKIHPMKNCSTFLILLFVLCPIFAQNCVNEPIKRFVTPFPSQIEICLEEVCDFGTDFQIIRVELDFTATITLLDDKCFRHTVLPGLTGDVKGDIVICNDNGECNVVPLHLTIGIAPNCLPDTIEVNVETSETIAEICLEEYCSDLVELDFTLLNPPVLAYSPMEKSEGLCLNYYKIISGISQEIYHAQICNNDSNTYCDTITFVFNIGNPTDIEDFEENKLIEVYPNPTTDFLHFSAPIIPERTSDFKSTLYDVQGREVLQNTFKANSLNEPYAIDVRTLSIGVYFLHIYTSTEEGLKAIGTQRIVVK